MAQLFTDRGHLDHSTEAKDAWREEAVPSSGFWQVWTEDAWGVIFLDNTFKLLQLF